MKDQILKLRKEGKTYSQIQKELGCSKSTISYHCGTVKRGKNIVYDLQMITKAVASSCSFAGVFKSTGIKLSANRYKSLKLFCDTNSVDYSHFLGRGSNSLRRMTVTEFVERNLKITNTKKNSHNIKIKLYEYGLKKPICEECNLGELWNGAKISLHLDHKNGNNKDNRLKNLRILCPNCHSQTNTYCKKVRVVERNTQ